MVKNTAIIDLMQYTASASQLNLVGFLNNSTTNKNKHAENPLKQQHRFSISGISSTCWRSSIPQHVNSELSKASNVCL